MFRDITPDNGGRLRACALVLGGSISTTVNSKTLPDLSRRKDGNYRGMRYLGPSGSFVSTTSVGRRVGEQEVVGQGLTVQD